jgi:hypothetical protein
MLGAHAHSRRTKSPPRTLSTQNKEAGGFFRAQAFFVRRRSVSAQVIRVSQKSINLSECQFGTMAHISSFAGSPRRAPRSENMECAWSRRLQRNGKCNFSSHPFRTGTILAGPPEEREQCMVPAKSDPKWSKFIGNLGKIQVTDLSTRMMMNRLKMKVSFDGSAPVKQKAIEEAYDFFMKNQANLKDDIKLIFG